MIERKFILSFFLALACFSMSAEADQPAVTSGSPAAAASTVPETTIKTAEVPKHGQILTDSKGMTLYTYSPDKNNGTSTCYGQCAVAWPPLLISGSSKPTLPQGIDGKIGTIIRQDGKKQVTYNGMPLYHYVNDKKPGDVSGHQIEGKWFVVTPS